MLPPTVSIRKTNRQECYGTIQLCYAKSHNIIYLYFITDYTQLKQVKQNNSHNSITQYLLILAGSEPKYHAIRPRASFQVSRPSSPHEQL